MIFALVLAAAFFYNGSGGSEYKLVKFSTLTNYLEQEKITEIKIEDTKITGKIGKRQICLCLCAVYHRDQLAGGKLYFPADAGKKLTVETPKPSSGSTILSLLPTLIMVVALGFLFYLMMNQGGNGKAFSFGKSKARLYKGEGKKITFDEVAGLDEEKEELSEVVDFLKDPRKYKEVGARIPKGILLVGPPGTGKTYVFLRRLQVKQAYRSSPSAVLTL